MPWGEVNLVPGVNVEATPTKNQTGVLRSQNGRFKAGLFQKLGGWTKFVDGVFPGIIRSLWGWLDLNNQIWASIASTLGLIAVLGTDDSLHDITPQTLTTNPAVNASTTNGSSIVTIVDASTSGLTTTDFVEFLTPISVGGLILSGVYDLVEIAGATSYRIDTGIPATATVANGGAVPSFTTTAGSPVVTVTLNNHGLPVGGTFVLPFATSVGGISVSGKYPVNAVLTANTFTIIAAVAAVSGATVSMNGGNARYLYYIALAPIGGGVGYGLGTYGSGAYGLGVPGSAAQTGTPITTTDWTQDNWGEILLACPENGGIYYWQPSSGFQNARLIGSGPARNTGMFASMAQQQIIAYGASVDARETGGIGNYQDPLLLKWCDIGDFFNWTQLETNFAREFRLPTGSKCVGGGATKNRNLVWTDIDVYGGVFNGGNSVYTWNRVGSNCGLIGKHAWTQQSDTVYWMGVGNFFSYSGSGVVPMPCTVWDAVFQNLSTTRQHLSIAASNTDFTEIWFFYPSITGSSPTKILDKFVKYNVIEQTWDYGDMDRCAWLDRSVLGNPIGAASTGIVYSHENGYNDDTVPLSPRFQTGYFYIDEGQEMAFIDEVYPDFNWGLFGGSQNAQISFTFLCVDNAGDTPIPYGPFVVTKDTPSIQPADPVTKTRIRSRQVALDISSNDIDSFWRLGKIRYRYAPDGRQ